MSYGVSRPLNLTAEQLGHLAESLDERTRKGPDCWLWVGNFNQASGRPMVWMPGRGKVYAHRVAWTIANGEIPTGLFVCHHCDTPACVRPDHLFLGTALDNNRDRVRKGRGKRGPEAYRSRYSAATVAEALRLRDSGMSYEAVARQLNIGDQAVKYWSNHRTGITVLDRLRRAA